MNYKKKTKFKKILMAVMMVMSIVTVMALSVGATSGATPTATMDSIVDLAQSLASGLFGSDGLVLTFFSWLVSDAVLPFFIIGMTVSLILLGVKIVRGVIWGT